MMIRNSEFTDLTKAQVEALLECFDFLRNGYIPIGDLELRDKWVIRLKHRSNGRCLSIWIFKCRYTIFRDKELRKLVVWADTNTRYRIAVDSDSSVAVVRTAGDGYEKLISSSLYDATGHGQSKAEVCKHRLA